MRLKISLAIAALAALGAVLLPVPGGQAQSDSSFDLQSDALGVLTFLDAGSGAVVPVNPSFPHARSRVRGPLLSAEGLAAWIDPGFLLAAGFSCVPECPPANPWDHTVAQTFWPQPPPQEQQVGVESASSPVLSFDSANGESHSMDGPASVNEGSVADVMVGPADAPVFTIGRIESTSESRPEGSGMLTTAKAVVSGISGPGGLEIETLGVTTEIRSDGTPSGTEVISNVSVGRVAGGGESFQISSEDAQSALGPLNEALAPSGVQVRPPSTCTNAGCEDQEVVGFDFISGTEFCSGASQAFCALATGLELEFSTPAGTPIEGQRYVLTLGRAYAQGFVGERDGISLSGGGFSGGGATSEGDEPEVLGQSSRDVDPIPATGGGAAMGGLGVTILGLSGWLLAHRFRGRRTAR